MPDPAFPCLREHQADGGSCGMELRDYFAARAMAALIAWDVHGEIEAADIAFAAYKHADAMLAARMRRYSA